VTNIFEFLTNLLIFKLLASHNSSMPTSMQLSVSMTTMKIMYLLLYSDRDCTHSSVYVEEKQRKCRSKIALVITSILSLKRQLDEPTNYRLYFVPVPSIQSK